MPLTEAGAMLRGSHIKEAARWGGVVEQEPLKLAGLCNQPPGAGVLSMPPLHAAHPLPTWAERHLPGHCEASFPVPQTLLVIRPLLTALAVLQGASAQFSQGPDEREAPRGGPDFTKPSALPEAGGEEAPQGAGAPDRCRHSDPAFKRQHVHELVAGTGHHPSSWPL